MKKVWNPHLYNEKHAFVYKLGEDVLTVLDPRDDEVILDLGCGTGDLTQKIAESCKQVIGIDNSAEMIDVATRKYTAISFYHQDARDFDLDYHFDAVFSNSVLHWIPEAEMVIQRINNHLKPGGRFIAEFGGSGCVQKILSALTDTLENNHIIHPVLEHSLFYPSISDYSKLLETNGFEVSLAMLFDRPTKLEEGSNGLRQFIEMFFDWLFEHATPHQKEHCLARTEEQLKQELFIDNTWVADYRRIRIKAVKMA